MVLCNLRIIPEYFCSSGDAHPSVITLDILMALASNVPRAICAGVVVIVAGASPARDANRGSVIPLDRIRGGRSVAL